MIESENIILIGMPGVGKSTVGVLLAKATSRGFLDTDVHIQAGEGCTLQQIIDSQGLEAFCRIEERYILGLCQRQCVIATGGSVVYSQPAMEHLGQGGRIVLLDLPLEQLERRISNLAVRGVVMARGQSLSDLHRRREGLYRRYAQITIPCDGLTQDQVVGEIIRRMCE